MLDNFQDTCIISYLLYIILSESLLAHFNLKMYEWQSSWGSEKILCLAIVHIMKAGANFQFLERLCKLTLLVLIHCLNQVLNVREDLQAWRIRAWGQGMSQEGSRRCWDESSEAFALRGHAGPGILKIDGKLNKEAPDLINMLPNCSKG